MKEDDKNELMNQTTDIALSGAGALVGYALGGPVGAVAGSVLPPTTKLAVKAGQLWLQRYQIRITNIIKKAFLISGKKEDDIFQEMIDSPDWADNIMILIRQLIESDPELDELYSDIIGTAIGTKDENERNRLIVLSSSIKGINRVQILILKELYLNGGTMSATDISSNVRVPELELRNAVRDLELRGMIIDNGVEPTIWTLRELGEGVAKVYCDVMSKAD